jgi:hypothetical protein
MPEQNGYSATEFGRVVEAITTLKEDNRVLFKKMDSLGDKIDCFADKMTTKEETKKNNRLFMWLLSGSFAFTGLILGFFIKHLVLGG